MLLTFNMLKKESSDDLPSFSSLLSAPFEFQQKHPGQVLYAGPNQA
jgi:hypothetical protein